MTAQRVGMMSSPTGDTQEEIFALIATLRTEAANQAAVLNALPANIALLDVQGVITSVNDAWRRFGDVNAAKRPGHEVGVDYLATCDRARGENSAEACRAASGIRAVLAGTEKHFALEYPCHAPTEKRWFLMSVTPLGGDDPNGVVVMHLDITERKLNEMEVVATRNELKDTLDAIPDLLFDLGLDGRYHAYHSPRIDLLVAPNDEMMGKTIFEVLPVDVANVVLSALREANDDGVSMGKQFDLDLPQGRKSFELSVSRKAAAPGQVQRFICLSRDITERKAAESRIIYLNRVHAMLSGINSLIVHVHDRTDLFAKACRVALEVGGFPMSMIGVVDRATMTIDSIASAGKDEALLSAVRHLMSTHEIASTTMIARAMKEKKAVVSNNSRDDPQVLLGGIYKEAGIRSIALLPLIVESEVTGVFALYSREIEFFHEEEMTVLIEMADNIALAMDHINKQERLNYLAYYDVLTGLANRSLFLERVAPYLRRAGAAGHSLAILVVDLERFKNFNDSLGRAAGDALLRYAAEWLTNSAGDAGLVARVGADQFAVLVPEFQDEAYMVDLVEKCMTAFQEHAFHLEDGYFRVAAKAGVALYPKDGEDADTLFLNAEAALKNAKAGGDRYLFYAKRMTEAVAGKLTLENQLRQAIDREEFVLHYQPKVRFASGKVVSAEALIRWNDPRTGLVPPNLFIPVLEETGLIHEAGRWVLRKAISDYLRWRDTGLSAVRVAVNVSALQLRSIGFIAELEQALSVDANAAAGLELEITESLIMADVKNSIATLQAVRAMGVTVAVDDFGTGYSSLSYLAKLPVDTLKIDRSFVDAMTHSSQAQALVTTIITLAHSLKLKVVAEGVETEEQSRLLRLLGCDEMQGYLFSKPLPVGEFETRFLTPGGTAAHAIPV